MLIRPLCADGLRTLLAAPSSLDGIGRAVDRDVEGRAELGVFGTLLLSKDASCSAILSKWGSAHPASGHITLRFKLNVECSTGWFVTQPTSFLGQSCVLLLDIDVVMPCSYGDGFTRYHFLFEMPVSWVHNSFIPFADCSVLIVGESVLSIVKAGRQQAIC